MSPAAICVIDDDALMRASIGSLLRSIGLDVTTFGSPDEFLSMSRDRDPQCLVLDVRMPGMSGLDPQRRLRESGDNVPVVLLSAHADVTVAVTAMKAGAVEFLTKPFREQDLLDAIALALDADRLRRAEDDRLTALRAAYARLTTRECEVMEMVVAGKMNKQIAAALDLSEVTVKMHRGRVMRKMGALSIADLVRMAERLGGAVKHSAQPATSWRIAGMG